MMTDSQKDTEAVKDTEAAKDKVTAKKDSAAPKATKSPEKKTTVQTKSLKRRIARDNGKAAKKPVDDSSSSEKSADAVGTNKLSNPVMSLEFSFSTLQAQRVLERMDKSVRRSLFNIDVILHIIGDSEQAVETDKKVSQDLDTAAKELEAAIAETDSFMLARSLGIDNLVKYTDVHDVVLLIESPLTLKYIKLIKQLDNLIRRIDTLWMLQIIGSGQRSEHNAKWQARLIKLAQKIRNIEREAHSNAVNKGKLAEIKSASLEESEEIKSIDGNDLDDAYDDKPLELFDEGGA